MMNEKHASNPERKEPSLAQVREKITELTDSLDKHLKRLAGPTLELIESPERAEELLEDKNPTVRWVALSLLFERWVPTARTLEKCRVMAANDPDETVRGVAILQLGCPYFSKWKDEIGSMLARIVVDHRESSRLREAAYRELFELSGKPLNEWPPIIAPATVGSSFPEGVDWSFVRSFLSSAPEPGSEIA